jgi:hypothetical protein
MGQYFFFYNKTLNEHNKHGCSYNFGLTWCKMVPYTAEEHILIFEEIIEANGWKKEHRIVAKGDYDDYIIYENGDIIESTI